MLGRIKYRTLWEGQAVYLSFKKMDKKGKLTSTVQLDIGKDQHQKEITS